MTVSDSRHFAIALLLCLSIAPSASLPVHGSEDGPLADAPASLTKEDQLAPLDLPKVTAADVQLAAAGINPADIIKTVTNMVQYKLLSDACLPCFMCRAGIDKGAATIQGFVGQGNPFTVNTIGRAQCHAAVGVPVGSGCLALAAALEGATLPAALSVVGAGIPAAVAAMAAACPVVAAALSEACVATLEQAMKLSVDIITGGIFDPEKLVKKQCYDTIPKFSKYSDCPNKKILQGAASMYKQKFDDNWTCENLFPAFMLK